MIFAACIAFGVVLGATLGIVVASILFRRAIAAAIGRGLNW